MLAQHFPEDLGEVCARPPRAAAALQHRGDGGAQGVGPHHVLPRHLAPLEGAAEDVAEAAVGGPGTRTSPQTLHLMLDLSPVFPELGVNQRFDVLGVFGLEYVFSAAVLGTIQSKQV